MFNRIEENLIMEEIRSQGHLSFKEYSTNYQYLTTEENRFSTQNNSSSIKSLEKEINNYNINEKNDEIIKENHAIIQENKNQYSLHKELNQFLSLLQTNSNNNNSFEANSQENINDDSENKSNSAIIEKIYCKTQELPIIFSTEESGISENNEKIKFRIEKNLVSIDNDIKKVRAIKEKTKKILQEEISLFERKCYLLEKKQGFSQYNTNNNIAKRVSINNIEDLPKIIKNFSSELEQIVKMLRFLSKNY